ncbi:MAG TPA: hypothetical protein VEX35_03850 [Allosphingosinicella sp.]|nr:hypothetical protein [Allosphingosinicella sp.]
MRRSLAIFALIGMGASAPAWADVTVRYRAVMPPTAPAQARENAPGLTITADDGGQARIEISGPGGGPSGARPPGIALITRQGVTYVALNGPQPGQQIVARLDDALALLTPVASGLAAGSARSGVQQMMAQRAEVVPGGAETVAGVRGDLYRVVIVSGETRSPAVEIVLSGDARLAPAGRELVRLLESLRPTLAAVMGGEPPPFASIRTLLARGTPLRISDKLVLDSFSNEDVAASRFDLPGPVMTREQLQQIMGAMMGGGPPAGAGTAAPAPAPAPPAGAPPNPQ